MSIGERTGRDTVTCAQAGIFFAEEKTLTEGSYNLTTRISVRGQITDGDLAAACRGLALATPALRIRLGIDEGTGEVMFWFSPAEIEIAIHRDVASRRDADVIIDAATRRGFDVDEGPLARFIIVLHGSRSATVVLVAHHLVMDGLSNARLTERFTRGIANPVDLDDPRDYLGLVRHVRRAEAGSRDVDRGYWFDRIRPDLMPSVNPSQTPAAAKATRRLLPVTAASASALNARAELAGVSLFKVLIAAVHSVLPGPGSGQSVVCVAASQRPVGAGRSDSIGCFVNEVPLVATRTGTDTIEDLIERESPRWSADLRRRNFPFVDLANRVSQPGRPAMALNTVMLGYRRTPRSVCWSNGTITCSADLNFRYLTAKTDLSIRFFDYDDYLECELQWSERLPDQVGDQFSNDLAVALSAGNAAATADG